MLDGRCIKKEKVGIVFVEISVTTDTHGSGTVVGLFRQHGTPKLLGFRCVGR